MTDREKQSLKIRLGRRLSTDRPEVMEIVKEEIDNTPTVISLPSTVPTHWFDHIEKGCLKARHGDYVLYKVDYLLDNLAREVHIMEGARRMRGGDK